MEETAESIERLKISKAARKELSNGFLNMVGSGFLN